jgi:ABC-2 type transport system ATP-binding protein
MTDGRGSDLVVDVEGLSVKFGKVTALDNMEMKVRKGEIFGIVGTNGAGKSTLIEVLSGMVRPSSGRVRVLGLDPIRQVGQLRRAIGVVPQETSLEEKLTAWENLTYFARLMDLPRDRLRPRVEEMIRFMGLWERKDDLIEEYSVGMKKRVHLACSLIHSPELILVDEPNAGFDPGTRREVTGLITEMNKTRGISCVLATHDLADARSICDRLAVLHQGRMVSQGTWQEITSGSEAKLVVKGISQDGEGRLRSLITLDRVREIVGGYEVLVPSATEAFKLAGLLEKNGVGAASISFEVRPEEMFDRLTGRPGDGSSAP